MNGGDNRIIMGNQSIILLLLVLLLGVFFLLQELEERGGDGDLENEPSEDGEGAETRANEVLAEGERHGLEGLAAELHAQILDDQGGHHDGQEQSVVEEVLKHVQLGGFELPGVDLVEDLQQHEHVEED